MSNARIENGDRARWVIEIGETFFSRYGTATAAAMLSDRAKVGTQVAQAAPSNILPASMPASLLANKFNGADGR
jgi:hypothetical protein